jgi:hypothetical protein
MRPNLLTCLIVAAALAGCRTLHGPPAASRPPATGPATRPADRLAGTWIADRPDPGSGDVQVKLVFTRRGHGVRLLAWSELPARGAARVSEAPYDATDDTIRSTAFHGGQSVPYRFDARGNLLVRRPDGTVLAFHRVK